jgi:hypothetical protein
VTTFSTSKNPTPELLTDATLFAIILQVQIQGGLEISFSLQLHESHVC